MADSKCKQCGVPTGGTVYCSAKCKWTWHNHNRKLPVNVEYDCEICGKHVAKYLSPSEQAREHTLMRFCSRTCAGIYRRQSNHWNWSGGRMIDKDGYVLVMCPGHRDANSSGYVREHRLLMEGHLGRRLKRREVVDHKNGNTSDNRIENLQLFASHAEHMRYHSKTRKRKSNGRFAKRK